MITYVCFSACDWEPWKNWGPCGTRCGGTRVRKRDLCCKEQYWRSYSSCLIACTGNLDWNLSSQKDECPLTCVFGHNVAADRCVCRDKAYGLCCEYSKYHMHTIVRVHTQNAAYYTHTPTCTRACKMLQSEPAEYVVNTKSHVSTNY